MIKASRNFLSPDAIYNEMSARAAETPRSARPAAAAAQRLRFPGDRNEPAAVLRARVPGHLHQMDHPGNLSSEVPSL